MKPRIEFNEKLDEAVEMFCEDLRVVAIKQRHREHLTWQVIGLLQKTSIFDFLKSLTNEEKATELKRKYQIGNILNINDKLFILLFLASAGEPALQDLKSIFKQALSCLNSDDYQLKEIIKRCLQQYGNAFLNRESQKIKRIQYLQQIIQDQVNACKVLAIDTGALIEIERTGGLEEVIKTIRRRTKRLSFVFHPDRHGNDASDRRAINERELNAKFDKVTKAGTLLSDPEKIRDLLRVLKELKELQKKKG